MFLTIFCQVEPIPYFLLLLKKNFLLYSIILNNSFAQIDLTHIEHVTYSDSTLSLKNFQLSENDVFSSIDVVIMDGATLLTFNTENPKYYNNTEEYFQRAGVERSGAPYVLYGQEARTSKKKLGKFNVFEYPIPPTLISVVKSTIYGYAIFMDFKK